MTPCRVLHRLSHPKDQPCPWPRRTGEKTETTQAAQHPALGLLCSSARHQRPGRGRALLPGGGGKKPPGLVARVLPTDTLPSPSASPNTPALDAPDPLPLPTWRRPVCGMTVTAVEAKTRGHSLHPRGQAGQHTVWTPGGSRGRAEGRQVRVLESTRSDKKT